MAATQYFRGSLGQGEMLYLAQASFPFIQATFPDRNEMFTPMRCGTIQACVVLTSSPLGQLAACPASYHTEHLLAVSRDPPLVLGPLDL